MTLKLSTIIFLITLFLIFASCAPKTRTSTPLSEPDRSVGKISESDRPSIKKVAIHVQADDKLDVNISTIQGRFWPHLLLCSGGLECILAIPVTAVAALIEESTRSSMDKGKENMLNKNLSDMKVGELMSKRLDEFFDTLNTGLEADITEINSPAVLARNGYDTLLDISIAELEMNLCPKVFVFGYVDYEETREGVGPLSSGDTVYRQPIYTWNRIYPEYFGKTNYGATEFLYSADTLKTTKEEEDKINRLENEIETLRPVIEKYAQNSVRIWITYKEKMISTRNGRVLLEREEVYFDQKCEYVDERQDNPELFVDMITRAIGEIALNTVNEIQ